MKTGGLILALVVILLAPIVLVGSGGDPRTVWSEFNRVVSGGLVAQGASCGTFPIAFGGSHTGTVFPLDTTRLKCEDAVVKNFAKLAKCILYCHRKKATAIFKCKTFDVDACDVGCREKYDKKSAAIVEKGCRPCLDAGHQATLANNLRTQLEADNQNFYCTP